MIESTWQVVRMLAGFILVLALAIWGTRVLARRPGPGTRGRYLRLVEVVSVGQNKLVCLVRVGSRYELIGLADKSVSSLGSYEDLEPLEDEEEMEMPGLGVFKSLVKGFDRFRPGKGEEDHEG